MNSLAMCVIMIVSICFPVGLWHDLGTVRCGHSVRACPVSACRACPV